MDGGQGGQGCRGRAERGVRGHVYGEQASQAEGGACSHDAEAGDEFCDWWAGGEAGGEGQGPYSAAHAYEKEEYEEWGGDGRGRKEKFKRRESRRRGEEEEMMLFDMAVGFADSKEMVGGFPLCSFHGSWS